MEHEHPNEQPMLSAEPDLEIGVRRVEDRSPLPMLRRDISQNTFELLLERMIDMGFTYEQAEHSINYCGGQSLEAVLAFLFDVRDGLLVHPFLPERNETVCSFCGQSRNEHLDRTLRKHHSNGSSSSGIRSETVPTIDETLDGEEETDMEALERQRSSLELAQKRGLLPKKLHSRTNSTEPASIPSPTSVSEAVLEVSIVPLTMDEPNPLESNSPVPVPVPVAVAVPDAVPVADHVEAMTVSISDATLSHTSSSTIPPPPPLPPSLSHAPARPVSQVQSSGTQMTPLADTAAHTSGGSVTTAEEIAAHTLERLPVRISVQQSPVLVSTGPLFTCVVCWDDISEPATLSCGHIMCADCNDQYLLNKIVSGEMSSIVCPDTSCREPIASSYVQAHVSDELFQKYNRFKKNLLLDKDPNVRWCPTPDCGTALTGSMKKPRLKCSKCEAETCFICSHKWHPNQTCDQVVDQGYNEWAKGKDVQMCPKCRVRVLKDEGCNHMSCSRCGYQWCWLCRSKYSRLHFKSWNLFGCPGLQGGHNNRNNWPVLKIIGYRLGLLLFWLFVFLTGPVWLYIVGIALSTEHMTKMSCIRRSIRKGGWRKFWTFVFCIFCSILFISALPAIIPIAGIGILLAFLFKACIRIR